MDPELGDRHFQLGTVFLVAFVVVAVAVVDGDTIVVATDTLTLALTWRCFVVENDPDRWQWHSSNPRPWLKVLSLCRTNDKDSMHNSLDNNDDDDDDASI